MGQSDSKRSALNRFINAPEDVSTEACEGFLLTSPVPLAVIEAFPDFQVIVRGDWKKDRVAVVSCIGAGHEPADVEFVGEGLLTAVACGRVWQPPTVAEMAEAIAAVCGPEGCLVIIKNYFATRLNVGLAMKHAENILGIRTRLVIVKDDAVTMSTVDHRETARGIAGIVPVMKIAGAAAAAGLSLDAVHQEAEAAARAMVSIGVAYNRGSAYIEAWTNSVSPVPASCMDVGVGVSGEAGWLRVSATATAKDIINTMWTKLAPFLPTTGPLFVMLNNLGTVPRIEMAILAKEVLASALGARVALLAGPATYHTALNTNGFSLTVLPLENTQKERLLAPTECRCWVPPVVPKRCMEDVVRLRKAKLTQDTCVDHAPSDHPEVRRLLLLVSDALLEARDELGELSAKTGKGTLGVSLARFATQLRERISDLPLAKPQQLFEELSHICGLEAGVFFSLSKVLFSTAASELNADMDWKLEPVVLALRRGACEAMKVGGVELNRRSFMDALIPALEVDCAVASPTTSTDRRAAEVQWIEVASSQARRRARATAQMIHASECDSAAYAPLAQRAGSPDGGAIAVAVILTALDTPPEVAFRVLPAGSKPLGEDDDRKAEERAFRELASDYELQESVHSVDSLGIRKVRYGTSLRGARAGTEVMLSERKAEDMGKLGLKPLQAQRIIDRRRMLNWLFRTKTNVVEAYEVIVTPLTYIYVTEKPSGLSLMELLESKEELPYGKVASFLKQILNAVRALHNNRIIHRDLKPESFSFDASGTLKLTDVCGMLCHLGGTYEMEFGKGTPCGTLAYMSPEALVGCARQASDMWAVGVMLHLMLSGCLPFHVTTIEEAMQAHELPVDVLHGATRNRWQEVPAVARDLVQNLLQRNARNRFSVDQALEHAFVQGVTGAPDGSVPKRSGYNSNGEPNSPLTPNGRRMSGAYKEWSISSVSKISWHQAAQEFDLKRVTKTLYLIRHGEAIHNIEEKIAKRRAAKKALESGMSRASKEFEEAVEEARKSVLHNPDFFDASLSHAGMIDAERCKCELAGLFERGLPMPTVVFTSPLQRTLQTAAAVFPYHSNVHAREDVRERRTGCPCDARSKASVMSQRPSFRNVDFNDITDEEDDNKSEDKAALRERCVKFLNTLPGMHVTDEKGDEREHDTICLVTHKGFLRELERGALGHPEATEFMNCEVRVYESTWSLEGSLESPSKLIYSNASLSTLQMRNFPASWASPESIEELPRKVAAMLSDFGELREPPEVWQTAEGGLRVTAAFTEQSAAAAAALRLHGLDIRSDAEKKARSTAYEVDRFHAQLLYDITGGTI